MNDKKFSYEGYDKYMYTGLQGFVMRQNHRLLSKGVDAAKNRKILEIGGGARPHFSVVNLAGAEEYWISDSEDMLGKQEKDDHKLQGVEIKKHNFEKDTDYRQFLDYGHRFTRIIASHVWEHVRDPEGALLKWVSLLEDDGQLDIAIPCDPGWLHELGRLVGRKKAEKNYNLTPAEMDLRIAREHVNSCQNLIRIMRFYSKSKGRFYPAQIPVIDMNLFVFFRVSRKNFN